MGKGGGRFFLLTPDRPCFLDVGEGNLGKCMILGMPEPQRGDFLAGASGLSHEEAEERVREGVRTILVGMGRLRLEHPELPAIMAYHGQTVGAEMGSSEVSEGGVAISMQDLALVGADYIACDDIHLAQQLGRPAAELVRPSTPWKIEGFPGFYSGSVGPVNWEERDQKCMNLVQISEQVDEGGRPVTYLTRLPFPHPPRKKIVLTYPEPASADDYEGFQTWFVIKAQEEEAKHLNPETILEAYLEMGALEGSRVDVDTIPREAQRGAEITQKERLRDKVVYAAARLNKPAPTESILQKADQLELEGRKEGIGVISRHLWAIKLRIWGHQSHQRRLGADEVTLDLTKYGPGIIPLIGPNGMGKTALQESFHPWLTEFSEGRNGKSFRDNYCLRHSGKETWYLERISGDIYRSLVEVDAVTENGGVTANLYATHQGQPEERVSNGKTQADYLEKVQSIFGTESMYVRGGLWMQNPSKKYPRLRFATEGEKKTIFNEFLGNEYLQIFSKKSGKLATDHGDDAARERLQADTLQRQVDELPKVRSELVAKTDELDAQRVTVAGILERGKKAKAELDELAGRLKEQELCEADIRAKKDQRAQQDQIVVLAETAIAKYTEAAKSKGINQKVVQTWDALKAEEAVENGKITEATEKRDRKRVAHAAVLKTHNENVRAIEGTKANLRTESARVAGDRKALQADIKHLEEELKTPLVVNCPQCDRLLAEEKLADLQGRRAAKERKLADLRADLVANGKKIAELDARIAAVVVPPTPPDPVEDPIDESGLKRVHGALAALGDIEVARKALATASEAKTRLEETRKQKAAAELESNRLGGVIGKLEATIDAELKTKHDAKSKERDALYDDYTTGKATLASLQTKVTDLGQRITELETLAATIAGHREAADKADAQAAEWRYLEWMCGVDGIQALELDAMGPSIALEANKLLDVLKEYPTIDNHYDKVEFRTQRDKKDGGKAESFDIFCHDTNPDLPVRMRWVDFAKTSVGEAVWLDLALDFAFGIVRERNQGTRLEVYLQDESDAALDEVRRRAFFTMLQAAHVASGRYQTIVTTHSLEAQQMFPQCIYLEDLVTKPASLAKEEEGEAA